MPVEEDEEEAEAAETEPNGNNQHNGDVLGELAFIFTFRFIISVSSSVIINYFVGFGSGSNHILCRKLRKKCFFAHIF